jgi:hypothetical protein
MKADKSLDGIISYLTTKYGGNVHEKGVVSITSKSVVNDDAGQGPMNTADLTAHSHFFSAFQPGQWICWDFGDLRISPTHYTIKGVDLKTWVLEGSLDGANWTEIDRQTDNWDFYGINARTGSFSVSRSLKCRFIRLTQIAKNGSARDDLFLYAVEFFGQLSE